MKPTKEFFQDEIHKIQFSQPSKTISLQKIQEIEGRKNDDEDDDDNNVDEELDEKGEEEDKEDNTKEEKPLTPKERRKLKAKYYRDTKLYRELKKVMLDAIEKKDITTLWKLYPSILKEKSVDPRVLKDVKYSLWFWNQMIKVCSEYGCVKKAFKFYNVLKKNGLTPNKGTFFWLLQTCAKGRSRDRKGGFVDYCFKVLDEMKKYEITPNLHAFNLILQTCANARDSENAKKIVYMMKSQKIMPDQSTFSSLMSCFDPNEEDIMIHEKENDIEHYKDDNLEKNLKEEEEKEKLERVFKFWDQMVNEMNLKPDLRAMNTLLRILRNSSQPLKTLEWFKENCEELRNKYNILPDHRTYDLLLSACCKAKRFHLAKELIENTIIPNSHLFLPDIVLCNSMLRVASRFDRQTLQNIIEIMKRENVTFDQQSYEIMIGAYGRFGDMNKALALFQEMEQKGLKQNQAVFTSLIYAICETTDNEKFRQCWETMKMKRIKPDDVLKRVFTTTCKVLNELEILKEFEEYIEEISQKQKKKKEKSETQTVWKNDELNSIECSSDVKRLKTSNKCEIHSRKTSTQRFNAFIK